MVWQSSHDVTLKNILLITSANILFAGLIGIIDYAILPEIAILYLIPIALTAWYAGKWQGIVIAVISSIIWLYDDLHTRYVNVETYIPYWESVVRLCFFVVVSAIVSKLRSVMLYDRFISRTDNLTKLANVRYFNEVLNYEIEKLRRQGRPFALLYMDIDNFKSVNDEYGHSAGDKLLAAVGGAFREVLRGIDLPARLGGDEFGAILLETSYENTESVVSRIQQSLESAVTRLGFSVTFSIGVIVVYSAQKSIDEIVGMADKLMYSVKSSGKNRAVIQVFKGN